VDSPLSEGPVQLLREGATPVGRVEHVFESLGLGEMGAAEGGAEPVVGTAAGASPTAPESRLLALLEGTPVDLDELVRISGEAPGRLMTLLLGLEMQGRIVRTEGMAWRRA
jgi:predicted Rossmann fold nucleotide-binding protein DprA/Smf involved in DNA uptake